VLNSEKASEEINYGGLWGPLNQKPDPFSLPRATDGDGFSLELLDPAADPNGLSEKDAWRPSLTIGGSPGQVAGL
jgi:hypothetical protein